MPTSDYKPREQHYASLRQWAEPNGLDYPEVAADVKHLLSVFDELQTENARLQAVATAARVLSKVVSDLKESEDALKNVPTAWDIDYDDMFTANADLQTALAALARETAGGG